MNPVREPTHRQPEGGRAAASLRLGLAALASLCLPMLGAAQGTAQSAGQGAAASASAAPADANPWLARIQNAATTRSFQGTLMFSAGGVVSGSKVTHYCDGREHYERVEVLDGRARLQYRHNDQLLTLWPATKVAMVEQRDPVAEFPALPAVAGARTLENYELRALGRDRVAGHDADVLMLKPRDKYRFAQRLWADHDTGLLLRNDVLGTAGEVLETLAFTDLQIGGKAMPDAILRPMKKLDGYRVVHPQIQRTQFEAEGWTLARPVAGFQLVNCIKRPLDATVDPSAQVQVLQSVFTDGLTHVSVFIEPFDPQRHKQAMGTSLGATHTLTSRRGDWWFTVVGEVPMATVQMFESMLERKR